MKTGSTSAPQTSFSGPPLRRIKAANRELAIHLKDGKFGAVSNTCNYAGGPLGEGRLYGDYIVCP
jgi:nitrite reductase/ring-hydroxylating ferredoxin subunit